MIMIRPGVAVFIGSMRAHMHLGVEKDLLVHATHE